MRALVDVDGVLADFTGRILADIGSDKTLADIKTWQVFSKAYMSAEMRRKAFALLETFGWWASQPVIPGALVGVEALRTAGYEVLFVTSPWHGCSTWGHARRLWLRTNVGAADADVVITSRKELLQGDIFIDDKAENVEGWYAAHGGFAVLFDAPYNQECRAGVRMNGWADLGRVLGQA